MAPQSAEPRPRPPGPNPWREAPCAAPPTRLRCARQLGDPRAGLPVQGPALFFSPMSTSEHDNIKAGVDLGRVRAAVGPVLSAHGVVLVGLEWQTDRSGWVLRLTIERE